MAEIYNLFSTISTPPKSHTLESANRLVPILKKVTEASLKEAESFAVKLQYLPEDSREHRLLRREYDQVITQWVEKVKRLGGLAKGLWLVDLDNGVGYLCWSYPENKVEHFHAYNESFRSRKKLEVIH